MNPIYKNFYRQFYLKTGGFIPTSPLNKNLFPGDYFQIKNGEIVLLGNIYRNSIISPEDTKFSTVISLNTSSWNFSDGISKPYSSRGSGQNPIEGQFEFSKQVLAFANKGSFIFRSEEPQCIKISNWKEIQQQLIINMTNSQFSFRELYIVTESATATSTTLAIAGESGAELELVTDDENFGLVDIFGHASTRTIQCKDIEYYHRETKNKPSYFKAKKLAVHEEMLTSFVINFIDKVHTADEWEIPLFGSTFHNEIDYSRQILRQHAQGHFLDTLRSIELNPNTAPLYFTWSDANLDDVEKLYECIT